MSNLFFYDARQGLRLVLRSYNPRASALIVTARYGIDRLSFIEVFKEGRFVVRYFVRFGKLTSVSSQEPVRELCSLTRSQIVAPMPLYNVSEVLSSLRSSTPQPPFSKPPLFYFLSANPSLRLDSGQKTQLACPMFQNSNKCI
jgi:hypothetical protein